MSNFLINTLQQLLTPTGLIICAVVTPLTILLKIYFNGPSATKTDQTNKVIILTGATDGIGFPTAKELLSAGATVIFAARNEKKTKSLISTFDESTQTRCHFIPLDLASFRSVKNFLEVFKNSFNRLDMLINNGGAVFESYGTTEDGIERTWQVNVFSPMLLTQDLLELLQASKGRVVNVASRAHIRVPTYTGEEVKMSWNTKTFNNLGENCGQYQLLKQYQYSKLGNVFFSQYLHSYFIDKGLDVKSVSLHPGVIATEIARDVKLRFLFYLVWPFARLLMKTVWYGAQTTLHCCYVAYKDLKSGAYYKDCAVCPVAPHAEYSKTENREAFIEWARSVINEKGKYIGVEFWMHLSN